MPLSAVIVPFAKELHRLENPFPKSTLEAATRFANSYINTFMVNAASTGPVPVPILPAALLIPANKEVLIKQLLLAYQAKAAPAFCLALQNAIVTYLNVCTATALFIPTPLLPATNFVFPVSLGTFVLPKLKTPTKTGYPAKLKLVQGIYQWLQASQIIYPAPPPPPPGSIGPQVWL